MRKVNKKYPKLSKKDEHLVVRCNNRARVLIEEFSQLEAMLNAYMGVTKDKFIASLAVTPEIFKPKLPDFVKN